MTTVEPFKYGAVTCPRCGGTGSVWTPDDDGQEWQGDCPACDAYGVLELPLTRQQWAGLDAGERCLAGYCECFSVDLLEEVVR